MMMDTPYNTHEGFFKPPEYNINKAKSAKNIYLYQMRLNL